jgi:hypothetical protein
MPRTVNRGIAGRRERDGRIIFAQRMRTSSLPDKP